VPYSIKVSLEEGFIKESKLWLSKMGFVVGVVFTKSHFMKTTSTTAVSLRPLSGRSWV